MTSLILLFLIAVSVTAAPSAKSWTSDDESNDVDLPKRPMKRLESTKDTDEPDSLKKLSQKNARTSKKGRMHKAFFLNYPHVPQTNKYPTVSAQADTHNDRVEERSPEHRKKYQDSDIFYIRLPPSPYFFVPGLGYISNPPKFTSASLTPQVQSRPQRPNHQKPKPNPFINLPIDFVSNGKPTGVYQYDKPKKPLKRKDTALSKLRKGPYGFNGRPTSIYLLGPNGEESSRQPIIYSDVNSNNIY